jgi:hypothetical protein
MADIDFSDQQALLAELARLGLASSAQLQQLLGRSQPTLSRLLARLAQQQLAQGLPPLVVLGRQRSARYALAQPLLGLPGQQALSWTDESGRRQAWGQLTHLGGERLHLQAEGIDLVTSGRLPWLLAPLNLQGFLGRLWARSAQAAGYDANPEHWRLDQLLALLLLQVHDLPGAIALGDAAAPPQPAAPADAQARLAFLDAQAAAVSSTLPAGSSAGGEQAKFLCADSSRQHWLVKFSPPLGTPFGERWSVLLQAEALALQVLAAHGVPVAAAQVLTSTQRSYLVSTRFDRIGAAGARHVVPLDAVHDAFVPGPRRDWASTCQALVQQRRLPAEAALQARALLQFGRLIGNSDMHFGNLSLVVARPADAARGRFSLAPVYDMLPMRWRPDVQSGELDWLPFTPDPADLASPARAVALQFWQRAVALPATPRAFRQLAGTMAQRLAGSG